MEFFSTGFQQIFAELEENNHDNWDYCHINSNNNSATNSNLPSPASLSSLSSPYSETTYQCDYYSYVDNIQPPDLDSLFLATEDCVNNKSLYSYDLDWTDFTDNLNCCHFTATTNYEWEEKFLDNYIELPDFQPMMTSSSLEKTVLCNESCDLFLKESTENLNKFRLKPYEEKQKERKLKNVLNNNHQQQQQQTQQLQIHQQQQKIKLEINCDDTQQSVFQCSWENCNKVYAKPAHLKAHLRRHLGDKPYICNWPNCVWKFSRSDELARHKRSHSGIKPFSCIYCPKCFARSDHLSKHRKVHERKMAASKGIFIPNLHQVRPGRKPKNFKGL